MVYIPNRDLGVEIILGPTAVTVAGGSQLIGNGIPRTYLDTLWGVASSQGNQYYLVGQVALFGAANGSCAFEIYQTVTTNLGVDSLDANPAKVVLHQSQAGWAAATAAFVLNGANIEFRVTPSFNAATVYAKIKQFPVQPWSSS
jgi:hypothetical protein